MRLMVEKSSTTNILSFPGSIATFLSSVQSRADLISKGRNVSASASASNFAT